MVESPVEKTIEIGKVSGTVYGYRRSLPVTIDIELKDKPEGKALRITGDIWVPTRVETVASGQIDDTLRGHYKEGALRLTIPKETFQKLLDVWDEWNLNDLRAGCEHQRAWIRERGLKDVPYEELIKIPEFKRCPICGFEYGSKWLFEPLPDDVLAFIEELLRNPSLTVVSVKPKREGVIEEVTVRVRPEEEGAPPKKWRKEGYVYEIDLSRKQYRLLHNGKVVQDWTGFALTYEELARMLEREGWKPE